MITGSEERKILKVKILNSSRTLFFVCYSVFFTQIYRWFSPITECLINPLSSYDFNLHYYLGKNTLGNMLQAHRLWSYNPNFSSGFPEGVFLGQSTRLLTIVNFLTAQFNPPLVFNLFILISYLSIPLLYFWGAFIILKNKRKAFLFSSLITLLLTGSEFLTGFLFHGQFGYSLSLVFCFLSSAHLMTFLENKKYIPILNFIFFSSLAMWSHGASPIILTIFCAGTTIYMLKDLDRKTVFFLCVATILAIIPNLLWVIPLNHFINFIDNWNQWYQSNFIMHRYFFSLPIHYLFFILGIYSFFKTTRNQSCKILLSLFLIFCFMGSFGSFLWGIENLEPFRFYYPAMIILSLLLSLSRLPSQTNYILIALALMLPFKFTIGLIKNNKSFMTIGCQLQGGEETKNLLQFLESLPLGEGRILYHDSGWKWDTFRSNISTVLQKVSRREFVSGIFSVPPSHFKFTQFVDHTIFGKNINNITRDDLLKYIHIYSIQYLILTDPEFFDFFEKTNLFNTVYQSSNVRIIEVKEDKQDLSRCYQCQAEVRASIDQIEILDTKSDEIVLKYHLIPQLKVDDPDIKISPIYLLDDPVPFIKLKMKNKKKVLIKN